MKKTPYITKQGNRKVLMIDDAPFIMLAGEVHNSNSSSTACMEQGEGVGDEYPAPSCNMGAD